MISSPNQLSNMHPAPFQLITYAIAWSKFQRVQLLLDSSILRIFKGFLTAPPLQPKTLWLALSPPSSCGSASAVWTSPSGILPRSNFKPYDCLWLQTPHVYTQKTRGESIPLSGLGSSKSHLKSARHTQTLIVPWKQWSEAKAQHSYYRSR